MTTKKCSKCGLSKPITDFYKRKGCSSGYKAQCKLCHNQYSILWDKQHPIEARKKWKASYKRHQVKRRAASRKFYYQYKLEALKIVANGGEIKCVKHKEWNCCGNPYNIELLSFDHIKGDGAKDRKKRGSITVRWIIKHPKLARSKFQILCMNAQIIKMRKYNETTLIK